MSGGIIELVAIGGQDKHLTENPEISFFRSRQLRHTNFAMESIEQSLNGFIQPGGRMSTTISRSGDLVHTMWLEFVLPAVAGVASQPATPARPAGSVFDLLSSVSIEVGGTQVDLHDGEWMRLWSELTVAHEHRVNFYEMAYWDEKSGFRYGGPSPAPARRVRVPLSFWFCRSAADALPLIALQYHEVKVNIDFTEAVIPGTKVALWVDYVFLDTAERRAFARSTHEYLIEQVQRTGAEPMPSHAGLTQKIRLDFNHPVRELLWVTQQANGARVAGVDTAKLVINGQDRFDAREGEYFSLVQRFEHHTGSGDLFPGVTTAVDTPFAVWSTSAGASIGSSPAAVIGVPSTAVGQGTFENAALIPAAQSVYGLSMRGPPLVALHDPASPLSDPASLDVRVVLSTAAPSISTDLDATYAAVTGAGATFVELRVAVDGTVRLMGGGTSSSVVEAGDTAGVRYSVAGGALESFVNSTVVDRVAAPAAAVDYTALTVSVFMPYVGDNLVFAPVDVVGATTAGNRNVTLAVDVPATVVVGTPVAGAGIQANTTVTSVVGRSVSLSLPATATAAAETLTFSPVTVSKAKRITVGDVALQQTETRPAVDTSGLVYMYSFAFDPEKPQPSGSCNFSKLDNVNLELKSLVPNLSTVRVYARNYNVLRIKNGMGGLAYSN